MKEVVKFPVNTPVEVTLECEAGTHVNGRYGGQVMYSLTDDRVMYVPTYVEQRFQELAIGAGEPLVLCKRQSKEGSRNRTEWSVRRAPQQMDQPFVGTAPTAFSAQSEAGENDIGNCATDGSDPSEKADAGEKNEEQPSGNSTAPTVQQSLIQSVRKHQSQHNAETDHQIVLAPAASQAAISSAEDNVYLPAMSMEVALARRSAIIEFTRRIMIKDQDFGELPGTNKPTLLKPGAEKLCNFFGLEPEFTPVVEEIDWTGAQHGGEIFCYARYRCRLLRQGRVVGAGEGSCNSWEAKYRQRWVSEEQLPEYLDRSKLQKREVRRTLCEFEFAIDRAGTTGTYGKPAQHWQRFRDAIRNGTARQVEKPTRRGMSVAWELDVDTTLYRVSNPDAANLVNTIQKMAQKRALIAATLIAVSASEFFTQDVEDCGLSAQNTDTAGPASGSKEAQDLVRDGKFDELRSKPSAQPGQDTATKPWATFGEMRHAFERVREKVGETRYFEEMERAGVQNPSQFRSARKALECYRSLAQLTESSEVA